MDWLASNDWRITSVASITFGWYLFLLCFTIFFMMTHNPDSGHNKIRVFLPIFRNKSFFTDFLPIQWVGKLILDDLWYHFLIFSFLSDHCNSLFWAKSTKPKVRRVCHHRAVAKNKDVVPAKKWPLQPLPVEIMSWNPAMKTSLWIQIQPKIYPHKLFWKTDYIQHQKNCQNILICFENKIEKNNASSSVLSVIFQKVALNVFCISSLFLLWGINPRFGSILLELSR